MHPTQLARPTRAASGSSDHVAAVQVTNLSKSYGAVRAVDDLTMRIEPGEIVAVLGPNGAGKSTTNEVILGLAKPDAGSVAVFGLDPLAAVRAGRIGAMLQIIETEGMGDDEPCDALPS
jgi:ABC-2 type transport system ATP-binding protein